MKCRLFTFLAVLLMLIGCKKSENSYHLHYVEDGCEYDYYIDDFDGLDYATIERYAAFDIADDHRSIVALMDSLIDAGTPLNSWGSVYVREMQEVLPPDSILPKLLRFHECEPDNAYTYKAIGDAYCNLGDTVKDVEYYHRGLEKAPDFSLLWYGLGMITFQQGDTVGAVNNLTKSLELAKEHNLGSWVTRIQMTLESIAEKRGVETESNSDFNNK